jgi:hypothetical protein
VSCPDSDTGEDLAEEVRKYHIPDFSNWKNHDAFERAFARLEKISHEHRQRLTKNLQAGLQIKG